MIGDLPKYLEVNGRQYEIRSDFRTALLILQAYDDPELDDYEKAAVCLECLFCDIPKDKDEAYKAAIWFLDGGNTAKSCSQSARIIDWEQDESMIFSAVNKSAGFEVRAADYIHWWTFLGYFSEISEGLLSQIINIRIKKSKGKKLEKYESEFYSQHREIIDLKTHYTAEEKVEIDRINKLLDG